MTNAFPEKYIEKDDVERGNLLLDVLFVFFACGITRWVMVPSLRLGVVSSDEVSAFSIAALLAGYDWREVVSNAGYYGIGYFWIFFPLLKLGLSSELIYRIVCFMSGVVLGATGVVAYCIIKKHALVSNRLLQICFSIFASSLSVLSTGTMALRNEEILLLIVWLMAYILMTICVDGCTTKRQMLFAMLMGYSLTIHSRAIVFYVIIIIWSVIIRIFYKSLFSLWFYYFIGMEYFFISWGLKIYRLFMFHRTNVRNATVLGDSASAFSKYASIDFSYLKPIIMVVFGQFYTMISSTFGGAAIATALFLFIIIRFKDFKEYSARQKALFVNGLFWGMCGLSAVFGQALTWLPDIYKGINSASYNWDVAYRAFYYTRYAGPFVAVFIFDMILLCVTESNNVVLQNVNKMAIFFSVAGAVFWWKIITPYVVKQRIYNMLFTTMPFYVGDDTSIKWILTIKITFISVVLGCILLRKKKELLIVYCIMASIYMNGTKLSAFYNITLPDETELINKVDTTSQILEMIRGQMVDWKIYVVDGSKAVDHQNWYRYQYINYYANIVPGIPRNLEQPAIILSDIRIDSILLQGYSYSIVDDDEFIYCKGKDYQKVLEGAGVNFEE